MVPQHHIIRKQKFEFLFQDNEPAWQLQEKIEAIYSVKTLSQIDKIFSQINDQNTFLKIDKLEIDLGQIPTKGIEKVLSEKLPKLVYEELLKQVERINAHQIHKKQKLEVKNNIGAKKNAGTLASDSSDIGRNYPNNRLEQIQTNSGGNYSPLSSGSSKMDKAEQLKQIKHFLNKKAKKSKGLQKVSSHFEFEKFSEEFMNLVEDIVSQWLFKEQSLQRQGVDHDKLNSDLMKHLASMDFDTMPSLDLPKQVYDKLMVLLNSHSEISTDRSPYEERVTSGSKIYTKKEWRKSEKDYKMQLISHFLKTGALPWWGGKPTSKIIETPLIELIDKVPNELKSFLNFVLEDDVCRTRLVYQFPDSVLLKIIRLLQPESYGLCNTMIEHCLSFGQQLEPSNFTSSEIRNTIWRAIIDSVLQKISRSPSENQDIIETLLQSLFQNTSSVSRMLFNYFNDTLKRHPNLSHQKVTNIRKNIIHSAENKGTTAPGHIHQDAPSTTSDEGEAIRISSNLFSESKKYEYFRSVRTDGTFVIENLEGDLTISDSRSKQTSAASYTATHKNQKLHSIEETDSSEFYVENAGLVLLWPYLGHFFKKLNFFQENRFIDEPSAIRAIHILQYLASGELNVPEFKLILNKLLCGWEVLEPVYKESYISDSEKTESKKLLCSVVEHWSALKNTSSRGFQDAFLKREGALIKKEQDWVLRVEHKAYDLLLDRLPWSISIVKLSWTKIFLYVEWC